MQFTKMHGAGNDFIIFDNTEIKNKLNKTYIQKLCNRRRGIGSDGLIVLTKTVTEDNNSDIIMKYYNRDGSIGEMCGNALRCTAYFAFKFLDFPEKIRVSTDSGILETEILSKGEVKISVPLINDFIEIEIDGKKMYYGNTGVPHTVLIVENLADYKVFKEGRKLRYNKFFQNGTNVNFIEIAGKNELVKIRTYERGVEEETLACGTGICASAVVLKKFKHFLNSISFSTIDNDILKVELEPLEKKKKVYLTGPAEFVFQGEI